MGLESAAPKVRFPKWVLQKAKKRDKNPSLHVIQQGVRGQTRRRRKALMPNEEFTRLCENQAQKTAFDLYRELASEGRCAEKTRMEFFDPVVLVLSSKGYEREYLVDSGATYHCIGNKDLTDKEKKTIRPLEHPVEIYTAKGRTLATHEAMVEVKELGITVRA